MNSNLTQKSITLNTWLLEDNWDLFETPEQIQKNLHVSYDLAKFLTKSIEYFMHLRKDFTGEDVFNHALNYILSGFRDEDDARVYLSIFQDRENPSDFLFYDAMGNTVTTSLLREVIELKWG